MNWTLRAAIVGGLLISGSARADDEPRPIHFAGGVGGYLAVTGPADYGTAVEFELYPGGRLDRVGLGLYYRGFNGASDGMLAVGLALEGGAARPRFTLGLHGELGYDWAVDQPVIGGGVRSVLTIIGPIAVSGGATAHVFYDGVDSQLAIAFITTLGVLR